MLMLNEAFYLWMEVTALLPKYTLGSLPSAPAMNALLVSRSTLLIMLCSKQDTGNYFAP